MSAELFFASRAVDAFIASASAAYRAMWGVVDIYRGSQFDGGAISPSNCLLRGSGGKENILSKC